MSFKQITSTILIALCATWLIGIAAMGADLIAQWPLNQNSGNEIKDALGNHHGKMVGGNAVWLPGKFDNGLEINGPNKYVEVEQSKQLELETVTLIAWVNLKSPAGRQEVASYADSYGIFADSVFKALLYDGAGWKVVNGVTAIKPETWYQTALSVDKDNIKLYVNGELDGELATPPIRYQKFPLWFGGGPADNQFWLTGILDEIEIWNDVLSEAEIMALFNSPPGLAVEPTSEKLTTTWGTLKSQ